MKYPLTNPQRNVYITEQFFGTTSVSNVGGYVLLSEKFDYSYIKSIVQQIIADNDGLCMRVSEDENGVYQTVIDNCGNIECVYLANTDELESYLSEQMILPFYTNGNMYDFRVIDLPENTAVMIKLHHYVADSWTISNLLSQLFAHLDGTEIMAPSYLEFIKSDSEYPESKKHQKDNEYWSAKYQDKPTYVSLYLSDSDQHDIRAGRNTYSLNANDTLAIKDYCEKHEISPAVFFEAIVSLYAMRINNADDITLCTISANRNGTKEKNTVGMFNTIVPMTVKCDWHESFSSFCSAIADEHYSLLRHSKYPLSDILDIVKNNHGKDAQLYDIMVSYQADSIENNGNHKVIWTFNGYCELGFMMNIDDRTGSGEYHINVDYQFKKFAKEDIDKIWARLMNVIHQVIADDGILFKDVGIVTDGEKEQILAEFNDTTFYYPKDNLLHQYLEINAQENPEKIALKFNGSQMTYKEFNAKANSLARYINQSIGATNKTIGIAFERSFEMMIAIYAVLKSGCAYMPIDPHFPSDRIDFMVQDSETPIIITQSKFKSLFTEIDTVILDEFDYSAFDFSDLNLSISSNDTAYVIYTSGSTGKPKGAMIAHHSVINRIQWMHNRYPLADGDVILQKTPYTFDVSVWELFWWSMYNGTLNILIPEGHKDPSEIIKGVFEGQVTHMHFVPSMLNAFLEYIERIPDSVSKLSSLKYVFASGEALQSKHVENFYQLLGRTKATLNNLYGPTECTVDVSYYDCEPQNIPENIPIGKPIDNTQLLVLDKCQNLLPVGVVGELYISGVGVGKGYLNRDELTKEKFVSNPFGQYPVMYKSGDLAKWLPDGNIEYCGRCDFQIKIRGLRVELGDIENALLMIPTIKQVLVTAPEINGEQHLCAYFTAEQTIDSQEITAILAEKLPDYMIPQFYIQLSNMPVNNNGKIDRKQLPIPVIQKADAEYVAPTNLVEEKIQEIVQHILNAEKISCADNLLDCGMTSLGIISMVTYLSAEGYTCKVRDIYEHKTICGIAKAISTSHIDKIDSTEDTTLYTDISDIGAHQLPLKHSNAVLITGATGFLGIHIVRELYNSSDKTIYCLVRNEHKLAEYIRDFTDISYPNDRIIPIIGDITKECLGIDCDKTEIMKRDVSDIIHCAADVSFFCSWERAKSINYEGTCNVINFAEMLSAKLHHMSTMSVSGDLLVQQTQRSPAFSEEKLFIGQKYMDNVYVHSKYLAETAVIKAIREDRINASIYRIANITWRASDGKFQKNYADNDLYILTKVMQSANYYPDEMETEDIAITPIDDLAKAICSQFFVEGNRVYHLYSDYSRTLGEYMRTLNVFNSLPMDDFVELISKQEDQHSKFALMYISGILSDVNGMVVHLQKATTPAHLSECGFTWSRLDEDYVRKYFDIGL
ncbi:MAG: amino acid adenylation domain-containing protein [Clostridia bacterium]|nr:amino acid adenylation domain-containing protein [Clostridia bacterium]